MPTKVFRIGIFRAIRIALTFGTTALLASHATTLFAQETGTRIDGLIGLYHELGYFNGSALVSDGGEPVIKKGYGLANMEWHIPNTPDTKFRIGSITKQFTATLVMQMVEEGTIDLDATVTEYLPDFPARSGDRITIHQLLNNTSGIVGYTELPEWGEIQRRPHTPAELVATFSSLDLLFEPGSKYSYSNSGFTLLGRILEEVSGETYEDLLHRKILKPVGMEDSGYDSTRPLLQKRAAGYAKRFDGSYENAEHLYMTNPFSAGALYSTVEDLYRWDQALYSNEVLSERSKQRMFTPGLGDYGYAWGITKDADGATRIAHSGGINGFNAYIVRIPESRRLVVLMNNTGPAPLRKMTDGILAILNGEEPEVPGKPAAPQLFETYQASGLAAALDRAEALAADPRYDAGTDERSRLAGHLLDTGNIADALELAKDLAEQSPDSEAIAVLLANAYRADGQRIEAIRAYSRVLELSETPRRFPIYTAAIRELSELESGEAE